MTDSPEHRHLGHVRRSFAAIEQAPSEEVLASFFTPRRPSHEVPNRLVERGAARTPMNV